MMDSIPKHLQALHKAVQLIDYEGIFARYGYKFGAVNGGCLMVAQAIQNVAGGHLKYLAEVEYDDGFIPSPVLFLHVVVELDEDEFMDGWGYQTSGQLQQAWQNPEIGKDDYPAILPLSFDPKHLYRNEEAVATLTGEIKKQVDLIELRKSRKAKQASRKHPQPQGSKGGTNASVEPQPNQAIT